MHVLYRNITKHNSIIQKPWYEKERYETLIYSWYNLWYYIYDTKYYKYISIVNSSLL